jgi:hypothetical protein
MKTLQNYGLVWIIAILISGCQTMQLPETNAERLAVTEITYANILDTATLYVDEGRLNDAQIDTLTKSFDQYEAARTLALTAIDIVDNGAFETQHQTMLTVIGALRTIIVEVEQ